MSPTENGQEIKAIAELAVHVRYMREEIDGLTRRLENTATKEDIATLRREIEANSPSALFTAITKIAAGIIVIASAVGVIVAILRAAKVMGF